MSDLKPCPFCGNANIDPEEVMAQRKDGTQYTYPGCGVCGGAAERWNDRIVDSDALEQAQVHIGLLRATLGHAREKLEIYRDHSSGEYHGGIEHTSLIRMIDESLSVT